MTINKSFVSADKTAHVMTQLRWPSLNHEQSGEQLQGESSNLSQRQVSPPVQGHQTNGSMQPLYTGKALPKVIIRGAI